MDKLEFFEFSEKSYGKFRVSNRDSWFDKNEFIWGQVNIPRLIDFWHYDGGNNPQDLVATGWSSLYLLSEKAITLLCDNNITGWKTYPALLHDKKKNIIEGYSMLAITGRCGSIDWSKSTVFQKQFAPNAPFVDMLRGINFDISTWDGSDFFIVKNTLHILTTQKVMDLFVKNKITNVRFTNIHEFEMLRSTAFPEEYPIDTDLFNTFMDKMQITS